jgi:hypothetical protein
MSKVAQAACLCNIFIKSAAALEGNCRVPHANDHVSGIKDRSWPAAIRLALRPKWP